MNFTTSIGIVGGIGLILVVAVLSAEDPSILINPLGLLVVFGGTLAAALVAFPIRQVLWVFRVFLIVLRNEKLYAQEDIKELTRVSQAFFRGDLAKFENSIKTIHNPFLRVGAHLVVDGTKPREIADILDWRIEKLKSKEGREADVFRAMASFAPAFGMAGTLLGLVNMLYSLGSDITAIGVNLAVAMTTTLYGILAANVIFKPIALKLENRTQLRVELMSTVLEGILLMAERRSPSAIRETMKAYTTEFADEIGGAR